MTRRRASRRPSLSLPTALHNRDGVEYSIMGIVIWAVIAGVLLVTSFVGYTAIVPGIQDDAAKAQLSQVAAAQNLYQAQHGNGQTYGTVTDLKDSGLYKTGDTSLAIFGDGPSLSLTEYTARVTSASGTCFAFVSATGSTAPSSCLHASESTTNLANNPNPSVSAAWQASSTAVGTRSFVTNSAGDKAVRSTRITTAAYALYPDRGAYSTAATGNVHTFKFTAIASASTTIVAQVGYGLSSATSITGLGQTETLTAGVPRDITFTFTIPAGYEGQPIFPKFYWASGNAGSYLDVSKVMWVDGAYTGPFKDGNSPGWQWAGAENNSISYGPTS